MSDWITLRSAGETRTATTTALIPAAAKVTSGQMPMRGETSRETPFASTSDSPTLSRVTNVEAMPARFRSMNSTRLKWVPTATISSAPRSCARRSATSSLIPGAETVANGEPQSVQAVGSRRPAVGVRVHEQLGTAAERGVRDRVEVADDHVRLQPDLEQRVGATVDGDEHRLEVADIRPHDPKVALVARPAGDDDGVTVAKAGLQRRELDPVGEQLALVAEMAQRVVGERLERIGDPALLVGERGRERRLGELDPVCEPRAVPPERATPHGHGLAVGEFVEEIRRPGRRRDRRRPGRARAGPGSGTAPRDGETLTTARTPDSASSSAETRSRSTWSMIARSPGGGA